jgi:hypothetical protein
MNQPASPALAAVLARLQDHGVQTCGQGWTARCPGHPDRTPSLSIRYDSGRVLLHCFGGCTLDGVLDGLRMKREELFDDCRAYTGGAPAAPLPRPAVRPPEDRTPVVPVPDAERLRRLLLAGYKGLETPAGAKWIGHRGLTPRVLGSYQVGFLPWVSFRGWRGALPDTWILPVQTAAGEICAVKLHREHPPKGRSKSLWAPLGTEPADHPRHCYPAWFPRPEDMPTDRALVITPGELKALACLGAGVPAVSPTGGESAHWYPGLVQRVAGRKVSLLYDDDPAGRIWADRAEEALCASVESLKRITFGRKVIADA